MRCSPRPWPRSKAGWWAAPSWAGAKRGWRLSTSWYFCGCPRRCACSGCTGARILADPAQAARTQAFLDWAAGYDDRSTGGTRTLANHAQWLAQFTCPVLELRGDLSVAARLSAVQSELRTLGLA